MNILRTGLFRGWIEFRHNITSPADVWGVLYFPVLALVVMLFLKDNTVPGTDFSLGSQSLPGILGMNIVLNGMTMLAFVLTVEREDGTLLRVKAMPNGATSYVIGKVMCRAGMTIAGVLLPLIPAALLFDGLQWNVLTLLWVLALGLVAVLPIGAVLGSLFKSVQSLSIITLVGFALTAISGVFYPISGYPEWVQWIAHVFPVYWLGLGLRSALLPDALSVAEIGESWRHLETIGVLGAWTVLGLVLAPVVLRRMARRESGSRVQDSLTRDNSWSTS